MALSPESTKHGLTTTDQQLVVEAQGPLAQAKALVITSSETYTRGGEMKVQCRQMRQKIVGWFRGTPAQPGPIPKAHATWKDLTAKEAAALKPVEDAEAILETKLLAYRKAEEQRRLAAQQAAEAEAKRKAEDERLAAAVVLATEAEKAGDALLMSAAEEMIELPLDIAPAYVASDVPKVAGLTVRKEKFVQVTNIRALVMAVAAREMLTNLMADETNIVTRDVIAVFLGRFQPPARSALVPVRKSKDGVIEGAGVLDVHMPWLRSEYGQQQTAFALAGVVAGEREAL